MSTNGDRKVVTDHDVLAVTCPTCYVIAGHGCVFHSHHTFARTIGSNDLSFHQSRVLAAQEAQFRKKFGKLGASDKALICYYAFVMLSDSVAAKATELIGKPFTSEQIQQFFAHKAIEELRRDRLIV